LVFTVSKDSGALAPGALDIGVVNFLPNLQGLAPVSQ
jgi:hypothetical protein